MKTTTLILIISCVFAVLAAALCVVGIKKLHKTYPKKLIVVLNSSNAMELGFLEEENIDAAVWIGGPGAAGFNSLGSVLAGTVNPSGGLVDTYAYDLTASPAYYKTSTLTHPS